MTRLPHLFWNEERVTWLAAAYLRHPMPEIVAVYNEHWAPRDGITLTAAQVKAGITNHGIQCHRRGVPKGSKKHVWTLEHLTWLRANRAQQSLTDLASQFNDHFGTQRPASALAAACKNHGIRGQRDTRFTPGTIPWNLGMQGYAPGGNNPLTRFNHGNRPHNIDAIGTIKKNTVGYWVIKVSDGAAKRGLSSFSNWRFLHRTLWEQHHGPIPSGYLVSFLDGDHDNLEITNLVCISRAVQRAWLAFLRDSPGASREARAIALERARLKCQVYQTARQRGLDYRTTSALFHDRASA